MSLIITSILYFICKINLHETIIIILVVDSSGKWLFFISGVKASRLSVPHPLRPVIVGLLCGTLSLCGGLSWNFRAMCHPLWLADLRVIGHAPHCFPPKSGLSLHLKLRLWTGWLVVNLNWNHTGTYWNKCLCFNCFMWCFYQWTVYWTVCMCCCSLVESYMIYGLKNCGMWTILSFCLFSTELCDAGLQ